MWENANLTVAPNMAINSNFYVAQNNATLDIAKRDGSGTQLTKSWYWDADGTLTLPEGGVISEGGGISGAIRLTPSGGANDNQALLIYPTAGAPEGDHIHLTAGGGSTELYLGNDFHYVKLVDGGNIELRAATANLSSQAAWTFDTTGNVDTIQALGIKVPNGVPSNVAIINSTTGSWEANPRSNLATTGGTGTGLIVNVAEVGGYASTIEIATAGTGYTNGDLITVTSGTSNATFTIVIGGRNSWRFGIDGNLTLPSANFDASPAPSSSPSIVFPSEGYIGASLETASEKFLIKSEGKTWTFDGSYEDLTFPGGTVFSSQNIVVVANANLTVTTFDGTSHYTTFESDGNLRLPETGYLRVGTGIVAGFASSPAPIITGFSNISAQNFTFLANGVNILSTVGAGTYGNTQVAAYLLNFDGDIEFTSSTAKIGNVDVITVMDSIRSPAYQFSNGTSIFSGITGTYSNTNTAAYLAAGISTNITTTGNVSATNFVGNGVGLTNVTVSAAGNIVGTSSNVTLVAGNYSYTFDNTGNVTLPANVFVGVTNTFLPNTVASFSANVNYYSQVTLQNKSSGNDATADYIVTANNGSDTVNFLDLGIINSGYDNTTPSNSLGNIVFAADSYIYAQGNTSNANQSGGNLAIGTTTSGKTIKFFAGGTTSSAIAMTVANTGVTVGGNITATGTLSGNGSGLTGVALKTSGSWTVTTGTNTYSFTVPASGTYQLWVDGNIPNGIIAWNATATITNTNVPVVGAQYAWVYNGGGSPIDFVSIPNQFTGTANAIVRSNVAPSSTTNRFDFGINNTSGGNVTVRYGWVAIS
jgi:hypothetical protein